MEKRYHSSGFHVSMSNPFAAKSSTSETSTLKKSMSTKSSSAQAKTTEQHKTQGSFDGQAMQSQSKWEEMERRLNNTEFSTVSFNSVNHPSSVSNLFISPYSVKHTTTGFNAANKWESMKPLAKQQTLANNASRGSNVLLGILMLILAAWFFWNISMLLGVILFFVALFVMSSGKSKNKNNDKKQEDSENSKYVDVVYLKNGSVVAGTIIEQIPNETLKIQTKDGSVFVYQMSDVSRMTKEKR